MYYRKLIAGRYLKAWLILTASMLVTVYASHQVRLDTEHDAERQFAFDCDEIVLKITGRMDAHKQVLLGAAALFDASRSIERDEWRAYATRMQIDRHFNGIQGLGFSLLVARDQLPGHIAQIRQEGFPDYAVHPASEREVYSPIVYLEPFEGRNLRAFGYDMYADTKVRRAAMDQARDMNAPALSGKVVLMQETGEAAQAGTLMYMPVYRKAMPVATQVQRRAALYGWVYSPFRMDDLLKGVLQGWDNPTAPHLHLQVYDGNDAHPDRLLYNSEAGHQKHELTPFTLDRHVNLFGREWTLHFAQSTGSLGALDYSPAWFILAGGFAASLLLFLLMLSYLDTRRNAARIAAELTCELRNSAGELALHNLILNQVSMGKSRPEVLDKLLLQIEAMHPDLVCSIFLQGAAPGDPPEALHEQARLADVHSCWSLPIKNSAGIVLGALTACRRLPGAPSDTQIILMERYAELAAMVIERIRIQDELRLKDIALNAAASAVVITDKEANVEWANQSFCDLTGYSLSEVKGNCLNEFVKSGEQSPLYYEELWQTILAGREWRGELVNRRKDGTLYHQEMTINPVLNEAGEILHFVSVKQDITGRKLSEEKNRRISNLYAALSQCNQAIVRCTTEAELFVEICRCAVEFGGMKMAWIGRLDEVSGQVVPVASFGEGTEYLEGIEISVDIDDLAGGGPTGTAIRENKPVWSQDFQHDTTNIPWHERGARFAWGAAASLPLQRNGVAVGNFTLYAQEVNALDEAARSLLVEMARDVSFALDNFDHRAERRRADERIQQLAHFDVLTGLPNRALFTDRISLAISLAQRSHEPLAVLFLDLDHFKNVNDTLGHSAGDVLLIEVAQRLRSSVRDIDTISRQGGDEFVLVLPGTDASGAAHVAEKLLEAVAHTYQIKPYELNITSSLGIAMYPADGEDFEQLLTCADIAMYRAKRDGRNNYCFFTPEMQTHSIRTLQLENALRQALRGEQFQLHYQPQISLQDGSIIGAEALLRWQHPVFGAVSPAEFISIAESSGQIIAIGEWVLKTAINQMKRWITDGLAPMIVAVNLSAVQFRQPRLPELVTRLLDEARLPAQYLELELTEGVAMEDPLGAISIMNDLHERGIQMSIDDFGTGYSSLSYLKKFKVYKLKIDQSFVRDVTEDADDQAIVSAIISLAGSLDMQTIAEGVETAEQLEFLRKQGCGEVQGYYFSKPLSVDQFEAYVRQRSLSLKAPFI
ncbi:MAG: EAL domain-containing protein [Gallionella sp.]|nr:EAL domain-containing protein [Gallionella sp.]